jgi:hypothetical protein
MAGLEVAVLLGAGLLLALLFLRPRPWTGRGTGVLLLFGAFAVLTTLSATWSIAPADTVQEAARTLAYLAVLGLAVAMGQLRPRASGIVAGAVLIASVSGCGRGRTRPRWPQRTGVPNGRLSGAERPSPGSVALAGAA